ncbi:MAG TPA: carbonic anhydrase family protein [Candidatus Limnocylindrales bacterium]|nr:carbonic anhydrase family protein [Candidatus Limnocylindrales bacterium]
MSFHSHRKISFVRFVLSAAVLSVFATVVNAQQSKTHWSYSGENNPAKWGNLDTAYATCSVGNRQSPINITKPKTANLPALQFHYSAVPLNIIDNGHTIQVNYPAGSTLSVGDKTYTLKQFHFHHPSEEKVNGKGYDLVAHLVHVDDDGHLAVVAVLLESGASNPHLTSIWKNLPEEKEKSIENPSVSVNATDLLPSDHAYYTFLGSLTTPPCSEGVTWYVLKTPVQLSSEQVAAFAKVYPMNARPIQPLNGRELLASK